MLAFKEEHLPNYNYKEYKHWEGDWELIDGIPYSMAPAPNIIHQELNLNIGIELKTKLKKCKLCKVLPEVDWKVNDKTVVRPDTLVVCNFVEAATFWFTLSTSPKVFTNSNWLISCIANS